MQPAMLETARTSFDQSERELLRLAVVGSVDDGKSTLIGRLLYDCDCLPEDQVAAVKRVGKDQEIDFSLFTDGLLAEREQGITIDVAYRYFSTAKRKVIVADTPGHVQYTRNMATGASTADAAVILVDARLGVQPQTRRHAMIAGLFGIPYLAVAINKMDLVSYSRERFEELANELSLLTAGLGFEQLQCFPISATKGDCVTGPSDNLPWQQTSLLSWLEALPHRHRAQKAPLRYVVQQVLRPSIDQRLLAGRVLSGTLRVGDAVTIFPSRRSSVVASITTMTGELNSARAPLSVAVALTEDVDVGRGDLLALPSHAPEVASSFEASLVWLDDAPLLVGRRYWLKCGARSVAAHVEAVLGRVDLETLAERPAQELAANDIGSVQLRTVQPLAFDRYEDNRSTGAFILIDPESNATLAAGMIKQARQAGEGSRSRSAISAQARAERLGHKALVVLLDAVGEDPAALERALFERGVLSVQVGPDVESALVVSEGGLVAIAVVPANGAEGARARLRSSGVTWLEADHGGRLTLDSVLAAVLAPTEG